MPPASKPSKPLTNRPSERTSHNCNVQGLARIRAATSSDASMVLQGPLLPDCLQGLSASASVGLTRLMAKLPGFLQGLPLLLYPCMKQVRHAMCPIHE